MQFERIAHESGIFAFERYINAAVKPELGAGAPFGWIQKKIRPDQRLAHSPDTEFFPLWRAARMGRRRLAGQSTPDGKTPPSRFVRDSR